ncbi:MAG: HAD-IA family hydrolase [Candidatus Aenigmarchaeota archaeon]|nr:HAD-IA family hydrolase [Candidatus Aenigmarchaeota archaeon]
MKIKAVIFDMDGTIINSEEMHTKTIQEVVEEEFGVKLSAEEIEKYVGFNYAKKLEKIFGDKYEKSEYQKLRFMIRNKTLKNTGLIKRVENAKEVIEEMKKNFEIALVTASSREQAGKFLEAVDFKKYFDLRIASDDVKETKPSPECYLLALKELGLKPKECLVLEDSEPGIKAAKEAGTYCIGIRHKYNSNQDFSRVDKIVDDIGEVDLELIKSLQ